MLLSSQVIRRSTHRAGLILVLAVVLLTGGRPAVADTFTWNQSCGDQSWHTYCSAGHCIDEDGPPRFINNWGRTSCGENSVPAAPGVGDLVVLPTGSSSYISQPLTIDGLACDGYLSLYHKIHVTTTLQVNGHLTFGGGGIAGPGSTVIASGATVDMTGSSGSFENGTLTNYGTFNINGDGVAFTVHHGARFYNYGLAQAADMNIWGTAVVGFNNDPANAFYNYGTFRKVNDPDGFRFDGIPLYNSGTFEIRDGWVEIQGGGSSTGVFDISPSSRLYFADPGNNYTLDGGTTFPNTGLVQQANGILIVPGDMTIPNLELSSGDLSVGTTVTCPISLTMFGGNIIGGGTVHMPAGSNLYINGWSNLHDTHLVNDGTLHWTNNGFGDGWDNGFVLDNNNIWELSSAFAGGPGTIHNNGTVHAFNSSMGGGGTFENAGLMEMTGTVNLDNYTQTAGTTRLMNNAGFVSTDIITVQGGVMEGNGTLPYSTLLNSGGEVSPGLPLGMITADRGYTQGAGATLRIELGGTEEGQFDKLVTNGPISLDGNLDITLANGYMPSPGDNFLIVQAYQYHSGQFASVSLPAGVCQSHPILRVAYEDGVGVRVVVTDAVCNNAPGDMNGNGSCDEGDIESFVAAMLSGGSNFVGCADSNGDCLTDGRDLAAFVQCLMH